MSRLTKSYVKGVKVSERHGAGEWKAERLSSLILIPLVLWAVWRTTRRIHDKIKKGG